MEADQALEKYHRLKSQLEAGGSIKLLQEYDAAKGAIRKGEVQVSKRHSEPNALLEMTTLAVRLKAAQDSDPVAVKCYVLNFRGWSVRKIARYLRKCRLPASRKVTSELIQRGHNAVKTSVEDL